MRTVLLFRLRCVDLLLQTRDFRLDRGSLAGRLRQLPELLDDSGLLLEQLLLRFELRLLGGDGALQIVDLLLNGRISGCVRRRDGEQ
jgi:hypothetical protein